MDDERRPRQESGAQDDGELSTDSVADAADDDRSISQGAWLALVRRARLGRALTAVALDFGSYADADGRGIFCGVARLALDCEIGYRTALRHLTRLRALSLVERTARVRKRGKSDEYRLTLPPDLLAHVKVPDPDEYREMARQLRARTARTRRPLARTERPGAEAARDT